MAHEIAELSKEGRIEAAVRVPQPTPEGPRGPRAVRVPDGSTTVRPAQVP